MRRTGYMAFALGVALLALLMLRANWTVLLHALTSFGLAGLLILIAILIEIEVSQGRKGLSSVKMLWP